MPNNTNQFAELPVGKLLWKFSMPAIMAMLIGVIYAATDRFFVAQSVGADGLAGLTVAMPIFLLAIAINLLLGVGGSALFSINLGQNDKVGAAKVLSNTLLLQTAASISFCVAASIFMNDILALAGGSAASLPIARSYISVLLFGLLFDGVSMGLNEFIRALGSPRTAMCNSILGAVLNIALDYVFVMELGMGVRGTAIASAISMFAVFCLVMRFFIFNSPYKLRFARPDSKICSQILRFGMTPFFINFAIGFNTFFVNAILARYGGDVAMGAWGISGILDQAFILPAIGLTSAVQSIGGYNFGAKLWGRLKRVIKMSIFWATIWFILSSAIIWMFGTTMTGIFGSANDVQMQNIAVRILRMFAIGYPLLGPIFCISTFFNSVGQNGKSLFLSFLRFMGIPIPLLFILPSIWGIDGVGAVWPVLNVIVFAVSMIMFLRSWRHIGQEINADKF